MFQAQLSSTRQMNEQLKRELEWRTVRMQQLEKSPPKWNEILSSSFPDIAVCGIVMHLYISSAGLSFTSLMPQTAAAGTASSAKLLALW